MNAFLRLVVILAVCIPLHCQGRAIPNFNAQHCLVHTVTIEADSIVVIVSGDCLFEIMTEPTSGGPMAEERIRTPMDHTSIVIPKDNRFRDGPWEEFCHHAKGLEGKTVMIQLLSGSETFEREKLKVVKCIDAFLGEPQ